MKKTVQATVPGREVSRPQPYIISGMKTAAESAKQRWERDVLEPALKKSPERPIPFTTISGRPVDRLYTPDDIQDLDEARDLGTPGVFPYTRGIHPTGYRGRL